VWRLARHHSFGPEVIAEGSREYRGLCFGSIALTRRVTLLVRAGIYDEREQPTVSTVGIELSEGGFDAGRWTHYGCSTCPAARIV